MFSVVWKEVNMSRSANDADSPFVGVDIGLSFLISVSISLDSMGHTSSPWHAMMTWSNVSVEISSGLVLSRYLQDSLTLLSADRRRTSTTSDSLWTCKRPFGKLFRIACMY